MTQDEIIEMAIQGHAGTRDAIRWAINQVVKAEREACAKLCENMAVEWKDQPEFAQVEIATMMDCALAIRARGEA
ncbi:hypothetical protein UFOVP24_2 [uncultured Caudovirales phage]|uniref:Uncharacterized protein n=1 Tax=uncultured Caudovirales phage TaxID=2100421 RepID=A0A6J5T7K4_9CAUD|nr:hypothetical protein UFOVP24_2 [uncultured Caudovirales phage]